MLSTILFAATACLLVGVNADVHSHSNTTAVPVELFVMSKCPDAVHCEATFDKVCKCFWSLSVVWTHLDSLSSSQTNLCPNSSRHQLYCTTCSIRAIKVLLVSVLSPHRESDMEGMLKVAHYSANMVRTSALATCKNYATDMFMVMRHGSHSSNA
jgi:hypothetical protein